MTEAPLPLFVAAGEALTDLIANDAAQSNWNSQVGGSGWNVARVMARLGVASAFAGAISTDVFGEALRKASAEAGLDLRFIQRIDKAPLLAVVYQSSPPRYFFIGDDSADLHFNAAALPAGWQAHSRWVHFGGISLAREPLAGRLVTLARSLKHAGVRISYDPNHRALMDARYDSTLRQMTQLADVVKVSDEDLAGLFRSDDLATAFATLRSWNGDAAYLYTKGAAGASLHIGAQHWEAPAPAIAVADSVGAGDASIAGLLFSLMRAPAGAPLDHLRFAVAAGAAACLGSGACPPTLASIEALLPQPRAEARYAQLP
ncbi:MAG: carbohydrate kinase [Pseudomonadota bacterium]|nr:carbohydrate kinase [Pseudomonadota bacterium]